MSQVRRFRSFRLATASVVLAAAGLILPATPAAATTVPDDPNAHGFIGLCDAENRNVSGGDIHAAPFVWKAVASKPPPKMYRGTGQNAVLNIYQPRPDVEAAEWSGDQLTAATFYRTSAAPSTQSTLKDIPLAVVVNEFPPLVNGLYELRMYFGSTKSGLYSATYPATFIRVDGSKWQVVSGGTVNCGASSGQSAEVLTGAVSPKQAYGSATPQPPRGRPSNAPSHGSKGSTGNTAPGSSSASSSGAPSASTSPVGNEAVAPSNSADDSSSVAWLVAALAIAIAAVAGFAWSRTRRPN
jgi:hypothetical protein